MKHLKLEVKTVKGWGKLLRVVEQTHRGKDFGDSEGGYKFISGEFTLISAISVALISAISVALVGNCLYVRGEVTENDNDCVVVPSEEWLEQCRKAVRAYNDFYAGKVGEDEGEVEFIE